LLNQSFVCKDYVQRYATAATAESSKSDEEAVSDFSEDEAADMDLE